MSLLSDFLKIKAIAWEYKDADFEAQPGGHYIVDTQNNDVTMSLPVGLTPSFFVKVKDAAVLTLIQDVPFTRAANVVTVPSVAHGLVNGQNIRILSSTPDSFTISIAAVTVVDVDTFTFPDVAAPATGVLTYTDGIGGWSDPNKFFVDGKPGATYTVMHDDEPFEVDIPSQELAFVYDVVNNNVVI